MGAFSDFSPCCALCVCACVPQAHWLIAEDEDAADAWADALALGAHIIRHRSAEALAAALVPASLHGRDSHSHGQLPA